MKKLKKLKKIIGWAILAAISVGVFSWPIIELGWIDGLITLALVFALWEIVFWAMNSITED